MYTGLFIDFCDDPGWSSSEDGIGICDENMKIFIEKVSKTLPNGQLELVQSRDFSH